MQQAEQLACDRIRRAQMADLGSEKAEVRFTVQITRAETGKVDKVEMVGFLNDSDLEQLRAEQAPEKNQE